MSTAPLPIEEVRSSFDAALADEGRVVVTAETGSGKSTQLPAWTAHAVGGRVLVVQPRRVAARALAGYLASCDGTPVGKEIGYAVRFDAQFDEHTRQVFVTSGMALQWFQSGALDTFDALVLDEFHERRWELDLLLAMASRERPDLPLVVTSATLDADAVASAICAPIITSTGRSFPVDVFHTKEPTAPSRDDLDRRVRKAVLDEWPRDDGDVLVFLPGKGEIRACRDALNGAVAAEIVEVHGGVPPSKLAAAFGASKRRRVYLATNVAETSVTLPGVRSVIDSGLYRTRVHRGGRSVLSLEPISHAAMEQRAGRAGRVSAGRCVRLWSERFRPRAHDEPEVARVPLEDLVMRAAACGVSAADLAGLDWVTPPPAFALEDARATLTRLNVLSEAGELTRQGAEASDLPVGAAEAKLLVGAPRDVAADLTDIIAVSGHWRRLLLPSVADEVRAARVALFEGAPDEVTRALRVLRLGNARHHGLHREALHEVRRIAKQLRALLGISANENGDIADRKRLVQHALKAWPDVAFVARTRALKRRVDGAVNPKGEPWGNGDAELQIRLDATRPAPVAGLVFEQEWLSGTSAAARGVGGMVLPCRYADLVAAGLGEVELKRANATRGRAPKVHGVVDITFAGVTLAQEERRLEGAALLDALPDLIARGSVMRGTYEQVADALHLWTVARDVERLDVSEPPPIEQYLRDTLETLGVERSSDLQLIEAEDLLPDVAKITGLAAWDLEPIATDFPREWRWRDGVYRCDVRARSGRVMLIAENKVAKRAKDPPKTVVPSFRGLAVELVNGSRRVRVR